LPHRQDRATAAAKEKKEEVSTSNDKDGNKNRPSNTVVQRAAKMTTAKVGGGCSICKGLERPQERSNNQPATSNNGADSHKQQQQ